MRKILQPLLALSVLIVGVPSALAGGYINVTTGPGSPTPVKWNGTITLRPDQGPLGSLSNTDAKTLVTNALAKWQTAAIPESAVSFTTGADLPSDNNGSALPGSAPQLNNTSDGINPIIFDTDGTITDFVLGAGASNQIIGFAGIATFFPASATAAEGRAVLNGKFIDGLPNPTDISISQMEGVFAHEMGHFLNLDHAQFNDAARTAILPNGTANFSGFPTMYPLVHGDIATLESDDKAWVSKLYPSPAFSSKVSITGLVRDFSGTRLNGVNIVARRASNPITEAYSNVSGYLDATPAAIDNSTNEALYEIPGLEPNTAYFLEFEEIRPNFTGGSRVGPVTPVDTDLLGTGEFINEGLLENQFDSVTRSTAFVTPPSGSLTGINLQLNGAPSSTNVAESDTGAIFPSHVQTVVLTPGLTTITGSVATAETGNVSFFGGETDIEDWFGLAPLAGLEIYEVTLSMDGTLDANLYLVSFDQPSSNLSSPAFRGTNGAGITETLVGAFDTTKFGAGTGTGIVYVGVDAFSGSGNYSMVIRSRVATSDAVVVSGVSGGTLNAGSGSFTINGRGFKNVGGAPIVTVSNAGLDIGTVTFVNSTTLNVAVSRNGGYVNPSDTDITVTNQAGGGGYSGIRLTVPTVPVSLSGFEVE